MHLRTVLLPGAIVATVCLAAPGQKPKIVYAPPENVSAANGPEMFRAYCAPCHGLDAKGDGPAGPALKKAPADLTQLTRKYGPKFPTLRVTHVIQGAGHAHGSRDMPIWGWVFRSIGDNNTVTLRIGNLTSYVESLQAK